jgi:hypothetical protein
LQSLFRLAPHCIRSMPPTNLKTPPPSAVVLVLVVLAVGLVPAIRASYNNSHALGPTPDAQAPSNTAAPQQRGCKKLLWFTTVHASSIPSLHVKFLTAALMSKKARAPSLIPHLIYSGVRDDAFFDWYTANGGTVHHHQLSFANKLQALVDSGTGSVPNKALQIPYICQFIFVVLPMNWAAPARAQSALATTFPCGSWSVSSHNCAEGRCCGRTFTLSTTLYVSRVCRRLVHPLPLLCAPLNAPLQAIVPLGGGISLKFHPYPCVQARRVPAGSESPEARTSAWTSQWL